MSDVRAGDVDLDVLQMALELAHRKAPRESNDYRMHLHEALYHLRQARQHRMMMEVAE